MTTHKLCDCWPTYGNVLKVTAAFAVALPLPSCSSPAPPAGDSETIVGPKKGYSRELGTLASMMAFVRRQVYNSTKSLSTQDLDFLLDDKANRIGALLLHLVATETYYQLNTFNGLKWDSWCDDIKKKWDVPMNLGDPARETVTGNNLDYYVKLLKKTREKTLAAFCKRNDKWLMLVDQNWPWGPTNNYCKWFHVTEHEATHNGQIKLLKAHLPGAKPVE